MASHKVNTSSDRGAVKKRAKPMILVTKPGSIEDMMTDCERTRFGHMRWTIVRRWVISSVLTPYVLCLLYSLHITPDHQLGFYLSIFQVQAWGKCKQCQRWLRRDSRRLGSDHSVAPQRIVCIAAHTPWRSFHSTAANSIPTPSRSEDQQSPVHQVSLAWKFITIWNWRKPSNLLDTGS